MAYNSEFPHFEANKFNLDWILEQYSTFNRRIQEIQDHFDEVAEEMAGEIDQLEQDFDTFKQTVNDNFSDLSHDIEVQVNAAIDDIQRQIDIISDNMADYIAEHMDEWQAEAIYKAFVIDTNNWSTASTENITAPDTFANMRALIGNPNYKFILEYAVEGVMTHLCELTCVEESSTLISFVGNFYDYQVMITVNEHSIVNFYEVKPTTFLTKNSYTGLAASASDFDSDGVLTNDNGYTLPKGTWLIIGHAFVLAAMGFSSSFETGLDTESNIATIIKATTKGQLTANTNSEFTFAGVYSSTGTNNIKIRPKLLLSDAAPTASNFGSYTVNLEFIKI